MHEYILTISCPDKRGIVAAVSIFLSEHGCNIIDSAQFGDSATNLFFMRVHFRSEQENLPESTLQENFSKIGQTYDMTWEMVRSDKPCRLLIMVSRIGHCLNDLLYRYRIGSLPVKIVGIVSNHETFRQEASWHDIPFHYLPLDKNNKQDQEEQLKKIVVEKEVDLVVLARYMQILSPELCEFLSGRCINIHHSFLPSFKGAKPYHQAHSRGVKLIGATAHYVTSNLDEGPIIEQGVERVDHAHTPEDLEAFGRDIENVVLARAVRYHLERRVLLNGNKTVVLR